MIHADPGGYAPFIDSGMIEAGIVDVFNFSAAENTLADWRRLARGYWPRRTKDGGLYFATDDRCLTTPEQWAGIGAVFVEGMYSISELLKSHISEADKKVAYERVMYEEDGETFSSLDKGHYNLVQMEIFRGHAFGLRTLPVPWLVWTSTVGSGTDRQNKETKFGPKIAGSAPTTDVPTWFQDCLYLEQAKYINRKGEEVEGKVAWFTEHKDPSTGIPCLAKPRIMPELYPEFVSEKYFSWGFVPLGFKAGIEQYFQVIELLNKSVARFERIGENTNG